MGKRVAAVVLDQTLNYVRDNCTHQIVCNSEPTSFNEATVTYALASTPMSSVDFTVNGGTTGGNVPRRVIVAEKQGVLITASGVATHLALVDADTATLLLVTTANPHVLSANGSNRVNIPAWSQELTAPV